MNLYLRTRHFDRAGKVFQLLMMYGKNKLVTMKINEYSKMMQTSDFKNLSGRERRRINSLIRDKQKRLDQLLISQGIQSLKDANRF